MTTWKKFSQNLCAYLVTEQILKPILKTCTNYETIMSIIDERGKISELLNCGLTIIKPILFAMRFVHAEKRKRKRKRDWALHLHAASELIPYFSASCHVNYAR